MKRARFGSFVAGGSVIAAATICAGGWAVITVDSLPEYIHAGEPVTLAYSVRQHGHRLLGGLDGLVEARSGNLRTAAQARPGKEAGRYLATLTLPKAGDWSLTIESGFRGVGKLELQPLKALERNARQLPIGATERGQQLFVAKGCVTCHSVEGKALAAPLVQGPRLVPHKYRGEYLAVLLANPALMPPTPNVGFRMPNLDLARLEIDALIAFLNPGTPTVGAVGQK